MLASIGDRLGLFKDMAANGPATSAELARRTNIKERYAREWLAAMSAAGYLDYDPTSQRFTLPAEHQPVLAQEGGPVFFSGLHQMLMSFPLNLGQLEQAYRHSAVACRQRPRPKHHLASRVRLGAAGLGSLLAIYQQHEGIGEARLCERLGCRPAPLSQAGAGRGRGVRL